MSLSESFVILMGRVLLGWFFISQALQRMAEWDGMIILVQMKHVPFGSLMLVVAVGTMIVAGCGLILGYKTQACGFVLFLCTAGWAYYAHDFWTLKAGVDRDADYLVFALAVALAGGLLAIAGLGAGRLSIDARRGR